MKPTNDNGAHSFTEGATFETSENINEFLKEEKNMETFRLISMTDFVLEQTKNAPIEEYNQVNETFVSKVVNYANFLKQPLKLEMFVPCDENGNVLDPSDAFRSCEKGFLYGKAKERVLFKGFNCNEDLSKLIHNDLNLVINVNFLEFKNMEELAKYKLELTPTAIKQIGL